MDKLQLELKIELLLGDIKSYTDNTLNYLTASGQDFDKEDIIIYLESIPEIVTKIKELLNELGKRYDND